MHGIYLHSACVWAECCHIFYSRSFWERERECIYVYIFIHYIILKASSLVITSCASPPHVSRPFCCPGLCFFTSEWSAALSRSLEQVRRSQSLVAGEFLWDFHPITGLQPPWWCRISHPPYVVGYCKIFLGYFYPWSREKYSGRNAGRIVSSLVLTIRSEDIGMIVIMIMDPSTNRTSW